jgi:uncharacterized membrane protein
MAAFAFALHVLGAVIWVGGMFAIYVCLRPALVTLEPPQRLRLMRVTFQKFFPWVWTAVLLLLASGYSMVFLVFGGFAGAGLHVHLMQAIGWIMIALFAWLFQRPWLAFKRAVDAQDWPSAGTSLDRIRQIISINLPLGLIVVLIGASGVSSQSNSSIEVQSAPLEASLESQAMWTVDVWSASKARTKIKANGACRA